MADRFRRIRCADRTEWLRERKGRLQASDASSVTGSSPWKESATLFDEKTGRIEPRDISDREYIRYGIATEPLAREQFLIDCHYFSCEYHQYDILVSAEHPFLGATLDGELTVTAEVNPWCFPVGTKGVYEGKTGSFRSSKDLAKWDGTESYIPVHYYEQCIHQLLVTGWEFAIVNARLRRDAYRDEDCGLPEVRTFMRLIDRRSPWVEEDIDDLLEIETRFWQGVQKGQRPSVRIAI